MKRIRITIPNLPPSSRRYESELELDDDVSFVDVIMRVDEEVGGKPYCLTHAVWNPVKNAIYNQVVLFAYVAEPSNNISPKIRSEPTYILPDRTIITLQPSGPCITDWEDPIDHDIFLRAIDAYKMARGEAKRMIGKTL